MKNFVYSLIVMLMIHLPVYSQTGWFWQNPLPQGNSLTEVAVIDQNRAVAVGGSGVILKTSDGGSTGCLKTVEQPSI